ncbi:MAG: hypothetical protein V7L05_03615 [Nostoc sp.]|uniref:hypothetical protein n=1 Tax=Nostoc sp. TaxID=1180 RepID=UPI002FF973C3
MIQNIYARVNIIRNFNSLFSLGLSAQLVGDRYTIIQRLKEYETVGVDLIVLKIESMTEAILV